MNLKIMNKNRYIVVFCVREGNTYNFFRFKSIKANTKEIKFDKENHFKVDVENPTYRKADTRYFCMDINGKQLHFQDLKDFDFVSSRINKIIMSDQIILQLAKATTTPIQQTYDWKTAIIFLIIGCLIGFIIKIFVPIG